MKIPDLNVLLYAVNQDSAHHLACRAWLERALSGDEAVGFPWIVLLGFLRLATNPRVFENPLSVDRACALVDNWLSRANVRVVTPGPDHWLVLKDILDEVGTAGNLTTDAHLAALAIENGAALCSVDSDFGRFKRLKWMNPVRR